MFDQLYERYHGDIRRFIYTAARRDGFATDDIAQNTWSNACKYLHTLKNAASARPWLYSIARNEAARYFAAKQMKFYDHALPIDGEETAGLPDEGAERFPEALADRDELARLLGKLGDGEQQLIILHYYYDMELKEIADMHGSNYNTVKSSFRRAMAKLRKYGEGEEALRDSQGADSEGWVSDGRDG
ncbi:MAG: sigma-70 family RNA polymerase sigma factor [Clostridiales Family XIII bacterium]|jgi:RNA polymerase sigma-70 factor (ECF subfamily)|nr:sigma-70 family RNA polymerase sigma factor [Clostridiales Family XIII bacterium]